MRWSLLSPGKGNGVVASGSWIAFARRLGVAVGLAVTLASVGGSAMSVARAATVAVPGDAAGVGKPLRIGGCCDAGPLGGYAEEIAWPTASTLVTQFNPDPAPREIDSLRADGSTGPTTLSTTGNGWQMMPAVSAAGDAVAWVDGGDDLYVRSIGAAGSPTGAARLVASGISVSDKLVWSPDGTKIAWQGDDWDGYQLYFISASASDGTPTGVGVCGDLVSWCQSGDPFGNPWSPDSANLYFSTVDSDDSSDSSSLGRYTVATGDTVTNLWVNAIGWHSMYGIAVAADGSIAFWDLYGDPNSVLRHISPSGEDLPNITTMPYGTYVGSPVWHGSAQLIFGENTNISGGEARRGVYYVTLDGEGEPTSPVDVSSAAGSEGVSAWNQNYVFSPDGNWVAFVTWGGEIFKARVRSAPPPPPACGSSLALDPTGEVGEVSTATGGYSTGVTDLALAGVGVPFTFTRCYNSFDGTDGPLGPGWASNLDSSLTVLDSGDVDVRGSDGQVLRFSNEGGLFEPGAGGDAALTATSGGGYELVLGDQTHSAFDSAGRLTGVTDRNGQGLSLAYTSGQISSVTDSAGREVVFAYSSGKLASVTLPDGRSVSYDYAAGQLSSVTDSRGGTTRYSYDAGLLSAIVDQNDHTVVANSYDAGGRVIEQTDALEHTTRFAWDAVTQTATVTDARGNASRHVYANGVLQEEIDQLGHATRYAYDSDWNVAAITDPLGNTTTMSYDSRHNMISRTAPSPLGYVETWVYDGLNDLVSHTDRNFNTTSFAYDDAGNLVKKTVAGARETTYERDPGGRGLLVSQTDPLGKTTGYGYDAHGNRISTTSPLGNVTTSAYDASGRLISTVSPRGSLSTFSYDDGDNRLSQTDPLGHKTAWTYDPAGNKTTMTDPAGKTWAYAYDDADRLRTATAPAPNSGVTETQYDANGNVTAQIDPEGDTTTLGYDEANQKIWAVSPRGNETGADPAGYRTSYGYDPAGNPVSQTDALGNKTVSDLDALGRVTSSTYTPAEPGANPHTTSYQYDGNGNVLAQTDPAGKTTSSTYDSFDDRVSATDALGKVTGFAYDDAGQLVSTTDPLDHITSWGYDAEGRKTSEVSPRGNLPGATSADYATTSGYDADGNLTSRTDPLGNQTTSSYDAAGQKIADTDANGHTTSYGHDELGRLTSVTDPLGNVTRYGYDEVSNLTSRIDANDHETTYEFDLAKRLTRLSKPGASAGLTRAWTYSYDADGNRTRQVDANGNATVSPTTDGITAWTHDHLDRLTGIDYSDSTPDVTLSYDAYGNRASLSDGQAAEQIYRYDADNQVTGITRGANSFGYAYDDAGQLTQRTYPDNTVSDLGYDDAGQLQSVQVNSNPAASYGYDADGNVTTTTLPAGNGYVATASYDRAGRLSELHNTRDSTDLSSFVYTRDGVGNPTEIDTVGGGVERYSYDKNDRVTEACYQTAACSAASDPFVRWSYDNTGNRLTTSTGGGGGPATQTVYTYNDADQLTQTNDGQTSTDYGYDENGNQKSQGSSTYSYDLANRLTNLDNGTTSTGYSYDGDGNRLQQTITAGATTNYLWDPNAALPALALETDGSNTPVRGYHYGRDLISMRPATGGDHYYLYDGLGSTANLTSATGTTDWTYTYDPYGAARTTTQNDPGAPDNPMQFTGEYNNPATGLYDLRAREYDPNDGRFTSEDPVAQTLTDPYSSDYLYVNDQPTLFVDPSGNIKCKSLGFASGMCTTVVGTAKQIPDTLAMYRLALSDPSYYKYFADHTLGFSHRCMRQTGCLLQAELGLLPLPAARGPKLLKILWRFRSAEEGLGDAAATAARIHGNSASSPATSYLYRLEDAATGDYLKTGISKNPLSRYSQTFMRGKRMRIVQKGSRREMLNLERFIVERDPGPLNRERWAGQYANDIRGGR